MAVRKQIFTAFAAFALLLPTCAYADAPPPLPTEAEESYAAAFTLPASDIQKGETVYVNIGLKPGTAVRAFEASVQYDNSALEYKRAEVGKFGTSAARVEQSGRGELLIGVAAVGEESAAVSDKLCTLEFTAKAYGKHEIRLNSIKAVFEDMTYYSDDDAAKYLSVEIERPKSKPSGGGSSSGASRGGGGGGRVIVSGAGVTSAAAPIPKEPDIPTETDSNLKEAEDNTEEFSVSKPLSTIVHFGVVVMHALYIAVGGGI